MQPISPWLRAFFNATAGLEKFIIAILAALSVWIGAVGEKLWGFDAATVIMFQALLGAFSILYTTNTAPTPPPPVIPPEAPPAP